MTTKDEGFTLIELLIVIVILGVLASVVVFAVGGVAERGETSSCKADRKTLEVAIEAYYGDNGSLPADETALTNAGFIRDVSSRYDVSGSTITAQNSTCVGV